MLSVTSRYHETGTARYVAADGREIVYLRRRLLPLDPPAVLAEHTVTQGERLDNLTARHLGDPEQFWRVCDANDAVRPDDLTADGQLGRRLVIPVPQGGS
jgi:hypothetical protein